MTNPSDPVRSRAGFRILLSIWILSLAAALLFPGPILTLWAVLVTLGTAGWLFFHRDPERNSIASAGEYLAPADGRIVAVRRVPQPLFLQGPSLQVSIFLGMLDVHVNRAPMEGEVAFVQHEPGKFLQAFREEASQVNEHNWIGLQRGPRKVLTKQVAGILARRIECWVQPGEQVRAGDRIGMIKLGSRVDLFLPEPAEPQVRVGDRVRAGETVVAHAGSGRDL